MYQPGQSMSRDYRSSIKTDACKNPAGPWRRSSDAFRRRFFDFCRWLATEIRDGNPRPRSGRESVLRGKRLSALGTKDQAKRRSAGRGNPLRPLGASRISPNVRRKGAAGKAQRSAAGTIAPARHWDARCRRRSARDRSGNVLGFPGEEQAGCQPVPAPRQTSRIRSFIIWNRRLRGIDLAGCGAKGYSGSGSR